ncbi:DUF1207 domain-containing protein [Chlorobium sp. BLA1]|nr:DUF1207 domain-containing protein [Candidatus Chlorobium masyuteum]
MTGYHTIMQQLPTMKSNCWRYCRACFTLALLILISVKKGEAEPLLNPTFQTIFTPLQADPMEPRIAVMPSLSDRTLQLDIGSSADLYQSKNMDFAVGVDFGTYSRLRRSESFKFPVDAIDYIFGINTSWKKPITSDRLPFDEFSARARFSHISAHFEDGHYDAAAGQWIQGDCPFPIPFTYSREFINLVFALSSPNNRIYAGYQLVYHTIPGGISPHSFQAGAELNTPGNTYVAADLKLLPIWHDNLNETKGYRGTWNLQAGVRLKAAGLENVRVAYNYFSGMSRHGMYFYRPESFSTAGIIIDF